jgi:alpha-methylacyl-CoA racemase
VTPESETCSAPHEARRDTEDPRGPLTGLTVIGFAGLSPASVACMLLANLGADVIRVDRRDHEADDKTNTLRRGRRSIVLDLKLPDGRRIARQLVAKADVLIEGYRPGVMARLGLGPDLLLGDNPGLVFGRLTGWGQEGPYALMAGHDITYLALTGALHSMGPADGPPVPPANYVADLGGGTMFLVGGVLAALGERTHSGRGQVVDAAMVDAIPTLAATVLRARARGEWTDDRGANYLDGGAPWYRTYTCSDDRYIAVEALESHFCANFVAGQGLDAEDLPDQWDKNRWAELADTIGARVATRSRVQWEPVFTGIDACVSPVLSFSEARLTLTSRPGRPSPTATVRGSPASPPGSAGRRPACQLLRPGVPRTRGTGSASWGSRQARSTSCWRMERAGTGPPSSSPPDRSRTVHPPADRSAAAASSPPTTRRHPDD